jgi:hypothetical protein
MSTARQTTRKGARGPQKGGRPIPGWMALLSCLAALVLALAGPDAAAQTAPEEGADADKGAEAKPPPPPPGGYKSGLYPMPNDAAVPLALMPPGTNATPVPNEEIFPPQTITIRFNHKKHVGEQKQGCKVCHAGAFTSNSVSDRLMPKAETCDSCHDVDHSDLKAVKAGTDANGQCVYCHLGDKAGVNNEVAPMVLPTANLIFPHAKHLGRNIQCGQCHGQVGELELATRDQLPRMSGCFACHNMSGAAQGQAKGDCNICHLARPDGRMQTNFNAGTLVPPQWMHNAAHTADFLERHKSVAANDSAFCGSCHTANECADCHDGRVRPRKVHPNDWLSMHPQAARQDNPRCTSCHQLQTFCGDCHRRVGVARDTASGNRLTGRRFHPPALEWTSAPRGPNHHAWEAMRNLNACVSCHTERDCATCHATKGLSGGQGVSPHPLGFENKCQLALSRNPRPCLVCHQSNDASLRKCQ